MEKSKIYANDIFFEKFVELYMTKKAMMKVKKFCAQINFF